MLRILLAVLIAFLAFWGLLQHRHSPETSGSHIEAANLDTVSEGVHMAGFDLSRWRSDQVAHLLAALSEDFGMSPVNARVDEVNQALIPELNGLVLDQQQTLQKILQAPSGSEIVPVLKQVPPAETMAGLKPLPIRQGNPAKRAVTFLINVAWGNEFLEPILEQLRKERVKASFFLVGEWAEKYPELARKITDEGHEIDSHGYSTVGMASLSANQLQFQLDKANQTIRAATGKQALYFSPHRGEYNSSLLELTRANGQQTILWSIDTVDWKNPGVDWITRRVERLLHPGGLILMHPTQSTVQALPSIIRLARKHGYRIIPLHDMLSPDPRR